MNKFLTWVMLTAWAASSAQSAETPRIVGIAHVAIRVADLEKSRAFYQSLGYTQPFTIEKDGKVVEAFLKINDRQYLELYPADAEHAPEFLHVCWEAVHLAALYPVYARYGILAPPVRKAAAGNLLLAWTGPEDQTQEITEYMPGSRHAEDFGKDLGPDRISSKLISAVVPMKDPAAAAEYFQLRMAFEDRGQREGASLTGPPSVADSVFGFLPQTSGVKLALVFAVDSIRRTTVRLAQISLRPSLAQGRAMVTDPDGNLVVFTTDAQ